MSPKEEDISMDFYLSLSKQFCHHYHPTVTWTTQQCGFNKSKWTEMCPKRRVLPWLYIKCDCYSFNYVNYCPPCSFSIFGMDMIFKVSGLWLQLSRNFYIFHTHIIYPQHGVLDLHLSPLHTNNNHELIQFWQINTQEQIRLPPFELSSGGEAQMTLHWKTKLANNGSQRCSAK